MPPLGHLINGVRIENGGRTQTIFNPSTGEIAGQVILASKTTVEGPTRPPKPTTQPGATRHRPSGAFPSGTRA